MRTDQTSLVRLTLFMESKISVIVVVINAVDPHSSSHFNFQNKTEAEMLSIKELENLVIFSQLPHELR